MLDDEARELIRSDKPYPHGAGFRIIAWNGDILFEGTRSACEAMAVKIMGEGKYTSCLTIVNRNGKGVSRVYPGNKRWDE